MPKNQYCVSIGEVFFQIWDLVFSQIQLLKFLCYFLGTFDFEIFRF